ncbi:MAG TPA: ABC transporter permease [Myxococcales bacterium]|nr:ABC transporter permease [Myxococcales bacterium]
MDFAGKITMDGLVRDVRFALRALARSSGFTAAAVLAMALGVGGSSAIFSVLDSVVLRPLAAPEPGRLVRIYVTARNGGKESFSPVDYLDLARENRAFAAIAGVRETRLSLTGRAGPVQIAGARVTASFFAALQVEPFLGRGFSKEEDLLGAPPVVVLTEALWRRQFGADPNILGQTVTLNGGARTVIGVMPRAFSLPLLGGAEALVPFSFNAEDLKNRSFSSIHVFGRLGPGTSLAQAQADLALTGRLIMSRYEQHVGKSMTAAPLLDDLVGPVRPVLEAMLAAALMVLFIACANVASMLLARAAGRQREIAIRAALGSSRAQIVRQLLTEALLLSLLGGALGVLLAAWGVDALVALAPASVPRLDEVRLHRPVLLFALGLSLASGIGAGLLPALQSSAPDLGEALKNGAPASTARGGLRSALVVAEVALALMLAIGSGLMIRTVARLLAETTGMGDPAQVLVANLDLPEDKYAKDEQILAFQQRFLEQARRIPGVKSIALMSSTPLEPRGWHLSFHIGGLPPPLPGERPAADIVWASPGYLQTLGIPLLRGRDIAPSDTARTPGVVLVNEAFVRKYLGGEGGVGRRITHFGDDADSWEIVGVIGDVHLGALDRAPGPQVVVPFAQSEVPTMSIAARTDGPPLALVAGLREAVLAADKDQPLGSAQTLEQVVSASIGGRRFQLFLLTVFGAVALALAALGIYGVMSYSVARRSREIGLRMALGAQASQVLGMVVGGGLRLALLGVALGLSGAFALTRALRAALYRVSAADPLTFAAVSALLLVVAALAAWVPARRATRVDPMTPLRAE